MEFSEINDNNIHELVKMYLNNKENLPRFLKGKVINDWDVSKVTNMKNLFKNATTFNEPLNKWIVSNVKNMREMFSGCKKFNQPLDSWDVRQVIDMSAMFMGCSEFNESLNEWKLDKLEKIIGMFYLCKKFNQPLDNWIINKWSPGNPLKIKIKSLNRLFYGCSEFNQDLNKWMTRGVEDMSEMFKKCRDFNGDIKMWDTNDVTNMSHMFEDCISFNIDIGGWDVRRVNNMSYMFKNCSIFNQNLSIWRADSITREDQIVEMFQNCGIQEDYEPLFPIEDNDAYEVHKESAKMNLSKLNNFLSNKLQIQSPSDLVSLFPDYIRNELNSLIDLMPENEKPKLRNNLETIMNQRLQNLNYNSISPELLKAIHYVLQYVKLQSKNFKITYINSLIDDCINAYPGSTDISCAGGILERIILSLSLSCTQNSDEINKTDCEKLISIINANYEVLIPEYIRDWYMDHRSNSSNAFPNEMTIKEKKTNLIQFILSMFPHVPKNENNEEYKNIMSLIEKNLEGLEFEPDDFNYGGGRKRKLTRKKKKQYRKKTNKKQKRMTKKKQFKNKKVFISKFKNTKRQKHLL